MGKKYHLGDLVFGNARKYLSTSQQVVPELGFFITYNTERTNDEDKQAINYGV